jgi:hypothetical protein
MKKDAGLLYREIHFQMQPLMNPTWLAGWLAKLQDVQKDTVC